MKPKPRVPPPLEAMRDDLLADDVERAAGQDARQGVEVILDRRRIGEEAVDGDEGGDRREDGEQGIIGHAGRHRHDPVLAELLIGAPQDVLPAASRDLSRRVGLSASAFLVCGVRRGVLLFRKARIGIAGLTCVLRLGAVRGVRSVTGMGWRSPPATSLTRAHPRTTAHMVVTVEEVEDRRAPGCWTAGLFAIVGHSLICRVPAEGAGLNRKPPE